MTYDWNLESIYESFECENFQEDLRKLDLVIENFKVWCEAITTDYKNVQEKLEDYVNQLEVYADLLGTTSAFAYLHLSSNASNEQAEKYQMVIKQKASQLAGPDTKVNLWISGIPEIEKVIESSELLKAHEFMIHEILSAQKHKLGDQEEAILAKMKNTGSQSWQSYKDKLISTHKVAIEVDGELKHLPLTEVLNMAYDSNKEIRKKAYEAEIASYVAIEEGIGAALNAIKGEVLTVADMRGYDSVLQMTLETSRMDQETLDAMFAAMEESMPVFRKYLRRKAEVLGYSNGLPWYEMYAPVVQKELPFSYEEGKAFVVKNFASFSDHLAEYAQKAMDHRWLDVYTKDGKVGGAFCLSVKRMKESRILLNYGDTFSDVITMAHELGHGFHNECMENETLNNRRYPMPLAETASTFCEIIVKKAAVKEVTGEEKLAIIEGELSDCTQVIVDIYSRYLFEKAFFEKRKEGYVSVKEIKELMLDAQRKVYGDGLDPECLHPYMWTWKSHYYRAETNFYNFPYAFGLLFAKGLYAQYEQKGQSFTEEYEKLLAVTGKKCIADAVKTVGLDVHDIEFWRASLQSITDDIETFMTLTK